MNLSKYTHYKIIMKIFIEMFPMNFKILMGSIKSRCDISSGTTQGWVDI
jgi:hypothetical protein